MVTVLDDITTVDVLKASNYCYKTRRSALFSLGHYARLQTSKRTGVLNVNFRKMSVRKTICDLEFSEHLL